MVKFRLDSYFRAATRTCNIRQDWPHLVLCLIMLTGLCALNFLSTENPMLRNLQNRSSEIEVTTQTPVETSSRLPRVNPLLELQRSGQRISSMPRQGVVRTFQRSVQPQGNTTVAGPVLSKKDSVSVFNYSACSTQNTMCVVSHPLPPSIFPHNITFCVHTGPDYVSDSIRSEGSWEHQFIYFIWATLVQYPDMHFIDIGANIGAMSLVFAKLGRQVIAVEPLKATLDILCQGVIENNVTDKVTIVPFALSNQRTTFKTLSDPKNWGHTWLVKEHSEKGYSETVTTILTDDLLQFISFNKAFLKIDVEGFEPAVFWSASNLFDKVYIPVVMMEWGRMQENIIAGNIEPLSVLEFMYSRDYSAYRLGAARLDRASHRSWGENIYWVHSNFTYEVEPWSIY